jgi:hypothetical protein
MLKNVTNRPIELVWGGRTVTLQPGQTCKYLDPNVELRQERKHNSDGKMVLLHTPDPRTSNKPDDVIIDPSPDRKPKEEAKPAAAAPAEPEEPKPSKKSSKRSGK